VGCTLLCVLAVFAMQALAVQAISPSVGSSAKHPKPIRRALRVRRASPRPVCCGRHSGMRMCADVEGELAVERVYVRLDGVAAAEMANAAAAAGEQQLWPAQAWEAGAGAATLVISPARRVVVLNDSSPAAAAGLRLLDVLVAVDGERTPSLSKAAHLLARGSPPKLVCVLRPVERASEQPPRGPAAEAKDLQRLSDRVWKLAHLGAAALPAAPLGEGETDPELRRVAKIADWAKEADFAVVKRGAAAGIVVVIQVLVWAAVFLAA